MLGRFVRRFGKKRRRRLRAGDGAKWPRCFPAGTEDVIVCTESPLDEVKRDIAYLQGRYDYLLEYVQDVAHSHNMLAGRLHSLKWRLVELRDEFEAHLEASGKLMAEFEEIQKSLASAQRMLQLVEVVL
eukprot:s4351_g8.t1